MKIISHIKDVYAAILLAIACMCIAHVSLANCAPPQINKTQLLELKANQWVLENASLRQQTAIHLLPCLADPDPQLRDDLAFEALSFWMRNEQLDNVTMQHIRADLLQKIQAKTGATDLGFGKPFAALVLAEVARADRRQAFLTDVQRQEMVDVAAMYLSSIQDYRGFDEKQGWRHAVAHAADWMMQLSLNPILNAAQHQSMLEAIAKQIRTDQHFYHYGESQRLMMPVIFIATYSTFTHAQWEAWFHSLQNTELNLTRTSQASLARQHNLTAFLLAMYFQLQETKNETLKTQLLPLVQQALKKQT